MTINVAILLFEDAEALDFAGPYEVFTTASRVARRRGDAEMENSATLDWIRKISAKTEITASVCTGASLLATAGVLKNGPVTTHWEDIEDLRHQFPNLEVKENVRWVDQGKLATSAGISAGIDMSLYLVSRLASQDIAVATARQMEFDWVPR